jgi:hypothetical protein
VTSDSLYNATLRPKLLPVSPRGQNLHRVNTSYVTKVVEKQRILIAKTFKFKIGVLWATIAQKQQISEDFI